MRFGGETLTDDEKRLARLRKASSGAHPDRDKQTAAVQSGTEKPVYRGSYDEELGRLYSEISDRPQFSYNPGEDGMYRKYRDDYIRAGRLAMKDSMGQAAALTGGYGSSYSESVGQQKYDEHLQKIGDIVPELYSLAYQRYQDDTDALRGRYDMLRGLRDREYAEYTDALDEYNSEQEQAYQREKDEYERGAKEQEQAYQRSRTEAEARAKYGDFSGYEALYGEETAKQMQEYWIASNPATAYNMGLITAERYYAMTAGLPGSTQGGSSAGSSRRSYYPSTAPDGRDAAMVQRELRNMGYNIAVDGAWGPKSQKAWEKAYGSSGTRTGGQKTR